MRLKATTAFIFFLATIVSQAYCQDEGAIEFVFDLDGQTINLPKIFQPNIDLGGRGSSQKIDWPQAMADSEAIDTWRSQVGFGGFCRIQYNLWEVSQLAKDNEAQAKLLANYETLIRLVNKSGGVVILNLFGMPAGMGKVLDKKSAPKEFAPFKSFVKGIINNLSCIKKYDIWYEVWSAPDINDFFLGRKQEYLQMYRAVAEAVKELEGETNTHIPVGGPSPSAWFANIEPNTVASTERSLIYDLIKFCYSLRLPLDFISWHAYSSDPKVEMEETLYSKTPASLIRDWLSYFKFDRATPLIIDEWNFDRNANIAVERQEKSSVTASYILSRLTNMFTAGINQQVYFSLEDFQNNEENVSRNVGVFYLDPESKHYKSKPKASFQVFRMVSSLGNLLYTQEVKDDFVGLIASKKDDALVVLIYNYIDPDIVNNFFSRNIARLDGSEKKLLIEIVKSDRLIKFISGALDINAQPFSARLKKLLLTAKELSAKAKKYENKPRGLNITFKNLKEPYVYKISVIDASCSLGSEPKVSDGQEAISPENNKFPLILEPYSVTMITLSKKPKEPEAPIPEPEQDKAGQTTEER